MLQLYLDMLAIQGGGIGSFMRILYKTINGTGFKKLAGAALVAAVFPIKSVKGARWMIIHGLFNASYY
jgi:hypothetical protein